MLGTNDMRRKSAAAFNLAAAGAYLLLRVLVTSYVRIAIRRAST